MEMTGLKTLPILLSFGFFIFLTPVLRAEELTLTQALAMSQTRSLQEIQAGLLEEKAKATLNAADGRRWPQLSAVAQYSISDDVTTQLPDDNEALLKVEQNILPFLSPDWIRVGQSQAEYRAAQSGQVAEREDVDLLVKQFYFSILRDEDNLKQMDKVTKEYQTLLNYVSPQFTVGRAPRFDVVKVKVSLSDLARDQDLTLAQLAGEKNELAQMLGLNPSDGLDLKPVSTMPEIPVLPMDGLTGNPTLLTLSQKEQAAQIGLDADGFSRLPNLTVDFRFGYTAPTWTSLSRSWDTTVQMNLPLFDGGQISAQSDQDRADWKLAQNDLENEKQKISTQLVQVQAQTQAYKDDQNRMENLLPEAQQASQAAVQQYRLGAMGIVETTDAVNLWLQTSLNERNAYYSYLMGLAQLERLTGDETMVQYE
jgi:outer membrane protein TolC